MAEQTISRSKLLKRAGVVGVGVWSVPFLASSASADVGVEALRQKCASNNAPSCPATGNLAPCATKNGKTCYCYAGAKSGISSGCCECQGNISCAQSPACTSNGNCPSKWKCTFNNCGRTCVPPCGQGLAGVGGAGQTAAGV